MWQDQGKWHGHPEVSPEGAIQAASFDELQFKVQQTQEVAKNVRELPRIERPDSGGFNLEAPRYVLSQEHGKWRGHLHGYPTYAAQGDSFDEVQFKLVQICNELISGGSATIRKAA